MKKIAIILAILSTLIPVTALASDCDQFFPNNREIVVPDTVVLCNTFYATVFDENKNSAIFSTEVFRPKTGKIERTDDFRRDTRVKNSPASSDYTNSGYDRGHLTPATSASTDEEMSDTFLMTNITPQEPTVNRNSWRLLETKVRNENYKYIVTGAIYKHPSVTIGKRKVMAPVSYYKIVYMVDGSIKVYEAKNKPNSIVSSSTVKTIEKKTGIRFQ